MLKTLVLLRGKDVVKMALLKGICHNKMYTVLGYTINQINCDDKCLWRHGKCDKGLLYSRERW